MTLHSANRWVYVTLALLIAVMLASAWHGAQAREIVAFESSKYSIGSIVIDTHPWVSAPPVR